VIGHVVDRNEHDARTYFLNRAARVYSVVVPVLFLTLLMDLCGRWVAPDIYKEHLSSWVALKESARLVTSLTFINQYWQINIPAGYDISFWSLSYEVTYYVVFGLWHFGGQRCRLLAVALLALAGPYIAALFSLWLIGLASHRLSRKQALTQRQGSVLLGISVTCLGIAPYFAQFFSEDTPFGGGILGFAQFFVIGVPFAGAIVGLSYSGITLESSRWSDFVQWAAGATFTIYLLHFPLGFLIHALIPDKWPLGVRWISIFSAVVGASFLVASCSERRKESWRKILKAGERASGYFSVPFKS
jgi:peptidoglycan/LPS O-acetylase OafA/YrhL